MERYEEAFKDIDSASALARQQATRKVDEEQEDVDRKKKGKKKTKEKQQEQPQLPEKEFIEPFEIARQRNLIVSVTIFITAVFIIYYV